MFLATRKSITGCQRQNLASHVRTPTDINEATAQILSRYCQQHAPPLGHETHLVKRPVLILNRI